MHRHAAARRFRLGWFLIVLAALNALGWVVYRWGFENRYTNVQITVDYDESRLFADAYRVPHAELLQKLKASGVVSAAITQQTLTTLRDNGRITIVTREEAEKLYPTPQWPTVVPAYRQFIVASAQNVDLLDQIFRHLDVENGNNGQAQPTLGPVKVKLPGGATAPYGIAISASRQLLTDAQMGFDPAQTRALEQAGLFPTVRMSNALNLTQPRVEQLLNEAENIKARIIILAEDEVLGYSTMIPMVARTLRVRKTPLIFGAVEFSKQKGGDALSAGTEGHIVRVHSVPNEEAAKVKLEILEDRYVRAARERNIRVLYFRFIRQLKGEFADSATPDDSISQKIMRRLTGESGNAGGGTFEAKRTALDQNLGFLKKVSTELQTAPLPLHWLRPPLKMGAAQPFGNYPEDSLAGTFGGKARTVRILGQFISGLGVVGGFLLLFNLFFDLKPRQATQLLILGVLGAGVLALSSTTGARLMAFAAGCVFSTIGILWGGLPLLWDIYAQKDDSNSRRGSTRRSATRAFCLGCVVLVRTTFITLLGPLIIMALMNNWKFLSGTLLYFGPKATQLLPLIFVSMAFAGEVFPHRVTVDGADTARARMKIRIQQILDSPFTARIAVIGLFLFVAGAIWIARTGNDSGMEVSAFELTMRAYLEQVFLTRPRTKEIFAGHPAMIFAIYFMMRRRWPLAFGAVIVATIGQADLLNTFCHIHIPIFYSVWRTIMGVLLGLIIGGVALAIWCRLEPYLLGGPSLFDRFGSTPPQPASTAPVGPAPVADEKGSSTMFSPTAPVTPPGPISPPAPEVAATSATTPPAESPEPAEASHAVVSTPPPVTAPQPRMTARPVIAPPVMEAPPVTLPPARDEEPARPTTPIDRLRRPPREGP